MGPIRGQTRMLPVDVGVEPAAQRLDTKLNASIHNRFDIEVVNAETGEVKQRAQAENVICNQLWAQIFSPDTYFNYIHYGTGSGTPSAANTSLFTFLGYETPSTSNDVVSYDWKNGVVSLRRKIVLNESTAIGSTLTEVGVAYSTTASTLVTHAMLKDMNGNQISIAKTSTDIINIYATIFCHFLSSGFDSGFVKIESMLGLWPGSSIWGWILGVNTTVLRNLRVLFTRGGIFNCGASNTVLSPTEYSSGNFIGTNVLSKVYNSAAKTLTLTATRLSVSDGNLSGGIKTINLLAMTDSGYRYLGWPFISFKVGGSWYSGSSITSEAIGTGDGTTTNFETDFPFIQSGSKIYLDGVEQTSGVSVDENKPKLYSDMGQYFELVDCGGISSNGPVPALVPTPILIPVGYPQFSSGGWAIYYNPNYEYGIKSFTVNGSLAVEVSEDLETWTNITSQASSISAAYRQYKYWRLSSTADGYNYLPKMTADTLTSTLNIHFATAPTNGAVITADYATKTIAKDTNHVFDFSLTIQLGEHTT